MLEGLEVRWALVVRVIEDQVVAAYAVTYVILLEVARWREISLGMVCAVVDVVPRCFICGKVATECHWQSSEQLKGLKRIPLESICTGRH